MIDIDCSAYVYIQSDRAARKVYFDLYLLSGRPGQPSWPEGPKRNSKCFFGFDALNILVNAPKLSSLGL